VWSEGVVTRKEACRPAAVMWPVAACLYAVPNC